MAGQQWALSADGGYLANPKLSSEIRHATQPLMRFRQITRVEPGFGKNSSDTLNFDKMSNVQTQGGPITEQQDIPETKMLVRKGSLVVTEWGNSIPYTGKLEALSQFDPENIIHKGLMNDMAKVFDKAVADTLRTGQVTYSATGVATQTWTFNGTPSGTVSANFNYFHLKEIIDGMRTGFANISGGNLNPVPPFPDGNYIGFLSVRAYRGLFDDPDFINAAKYSYPREYFYGELDEVVYNCRLIVSNNVNALSNGSTNSVGEALFIGDDAVVEGLVIKEELRAKLPVKYGRDKGLAWYGLLNFQRVWDAVVDGEEHIVRFIAG
jgi:N4-gp56 family major capsid protein